MMMTSLETLKTSFALDIKLFEESVSRDIGTEGVPKSEGAGEYDPSRYFFLRLAWPPPGAVGKRVDDLDDRAGLQRSADVVGEPRVVARGESGGDRRGCNSDAPGHNGSR